MIDYGTEEDSEQGGRQNAAVLDSTADVECSRGQGVNLHSSLHVNVDGSDDGEKLRWTAYPFQHLEEAIQANQIKCLRLVYECLVE